MDELVLSYLVRKNCPQTALRFASESNDLSSIWEKLQCEKSLELTEPELFGRGLEEILSLYANSQTVSTASDVPLALWSFQIKLNTLLSDFRFILAMFDDWPVKPSPNMYKRTHNRPCKRPPVILTCTESEDNLVIAEPSGDLETMDVTGSSSTGNPEPQHAHSVSCPQPAHAPAEPPDQHAARTGSVASVSSNRRKKAPPKPKTSAGGHLEEQIVFRKLQSMAPSELLPSKLADMINKGRSGFDGTVHSENNGPNRLDEQTKEADAADGDSLIARIEEDQAFEELLACLERGDDLFSEQPASLTAASVNSSLVDESLHTPPHSPHHVHPEAGDQPSANQPTVIATCTSTIKQSERSASRAPPKKRAKLVKCSLGGPVQYSWASVSQPRRVRKHSATTSAHQQSCEDIGAGDHLRLAMEAAGLIPPRKSKSAHSVQDVAPGVHRSPVNKTQQFDHQSPPKAHQSKLAPDDQQKPSSIGLTSDKHSPFRLSAERSTVDQPSPLQITDKHTSASASHRSSPNPVGSGRSLADGLRAERSLAVGYRTGLSLADDVRSERSLANESVGGRLLAAEKQTLPNIPVGSGRLLADGIRGERSLAVGIRAERSLAVGDVAGRSMTDKCLGGRSLADNAPLSTSSPSVISSVALVNAGEHVVTSLVVDEQGERERETSTSPVDGEEVIYVEIDEEPNASLSPVDNQSTTTPRAGSATKPKKRRQRKATLISKCAKLPTAQSSGQVDTVLRRLNQSTTVASSSHSASNPGDLNRSSVSATELLEFGSSSSQATSVFVEPEEVNLEAIQASSSSDLTPTAPSTSDKTSEHERGSSTAGSKNGRYARKKKSDTALHPEPLIKIPLSWCLVQPESQAKGRKKGRKRTSTSLQEHSLAPKMTNSGRKKVSNQSIARKSRAPHSLPAGSKPKDPTASLSGVSLVSSTLVTPGRSCDSFPTPPKLWPAGPLLDRSFSSIGSIVRTPAPTEDSLSRDAPSQDGLGGAEGSRRSMSPKLCLEPVVNRTLERELESVASALQTSQSEDSAVDLLQTTPSKSSSNTSVIPTTPKLALDDEDLPPPVSLSSEPSLERIPSWDDSKSDCSRPPKTPEPRSHSPSPIKKTMLQCPQEATSRKRQGGTTETLLSVVRDALAPLPVYSVESEALIQQDTEPSTSAVCGKPFTSTTVTVSCAVACKGSQELLDNSGRVARRRKRFCAPWKQISSETIQPTESFSLASSSTSQHSEGDNVAQATTSKTEESVFKKPLFAPRKRMAASLSPTRDLPVCRQIVKSNVSCVPRTDYSANKNLSEAILFQMGRKRCRNKAGSSKTEKPSSKPLALNITNESIQFVLRQLHGNK